MAYPSAETLEKCMRSALQNAHVSPQKVDLLNAHATGTIIGDIAESQAAHAVFGSSVKINSLKGHLGHTMGASGALELIVCVKMLEENTVIPTKNLSTVDERCAPAQYVKETEKRQINTLVKNSFAIGGNNCSLLLRRSL
jgi:3-oxoacyl-[acyl-carrier-protein] synthase II